MKQGNRVSCRTLWHKALNQGGFPFVTAALAMYPAAAEGCQFLTDDRTEYRCIWDHRFAAGEEVILQVTPTVTVAEVGRALQLSAVTSVSGHQQAVAEGDHNNNMTAYSFITTRVSGV